MFFYGLRLLFEARRIKLALLDRAGRTSLDNTASTNVLNRTKGDLKGSFSGDIHFSRLTVNEVPGTLPEDIDLTSVRRMNKFGGAMADCVATSLLPLSWYVSRVIVFAGLQRLLNNAHCTDGRVMA